MLRIYPSNQTEALAYVMSELIARKPLSDPLRAETVIIQSQGMGTWLQQELAGQLNIAAMIDTFMPARFVWQLARSLRLENRVDHRFEKACLRWEIFRVLPEKLALPEYASLKRYLEQDRNNASGFASNRSVASLRVFQLSQQIADVFDAYQNYRPDWIECWENGESPDSLDDTVSEIEAWQRDLWQSLYPALPQHERRHRPALLRSLSERLSELCPDLHDALPERVFVFGLSAMPPQWLPILERLSLHIDVHFLIQNPCRYYWGDEVTEVQRLKLQQSLVSKNISLETAADTFVENNALLASWGRQGREYFSILTRMEENQTHVHWTDELYVDPGLDSALKAIQTDILNLDSLEREWRIGDESIQFARCHSRLREVEALKDYILDKLNAHPDLNPRDIVVMMPEVQEFAPLIDAVFSRPVAGADGSDIPIPFSISDQMLAMEQPMVDVLLSILNCRTLRVTSNQVLSWLEVEAIRERFDINYEQLASIEKWFNQLNIRWGLDGADKADMLGQTVSSNGRVHENNTWLHGLSRILEGYLCADQGPSHGSRDKDMQPFILSTTEDQVLAGKLLRFLDLIRTTRLRLRGTEKIAVWEERLSEVWSAWLDESVLDDSIRLLWEQSLNDLAEQCAVSGFDQPIDFGIVASNLNNAFSQQRISQRFLAGRINFCTLMPMRSIPFKMVCLLGMNEGQYPRPENRISYDLLSRTRTRTGDRSRREDDRYLFLEALCSAREWLYISYCAFNSQDNSERFPSVLVSELREYCAQYYGMPSKGNKIKERQVSGSLLEILTRDHRLQPFHPEYYCQLEHVAEGEAVPTNWLSFAQDWVRLHHAMTEEEPSNKTSSKPPEAPQLELFQGNGDQDDGMSPTLDLEELIASLVHPLRFYYQNNFGVTFTALHQALEDDEPFNLDGLDRYRLKQDLVESWLDPSMSEESILARWYGQDQMPPKPLDTMSIASTQESLKDIQTALSAVESVRSDEINVTCLAGQVRVQGSILVDQNSAVFSVCVGSQHAAAFWRLWVQQVFWCLHQNQQCGGNNAASPGEAYLVLPEKVSRLPVIPADQCQQMADELVDWCMNAKQAPQAFLAKTAYASLFETEAKVKSTFYGGGQYGPVGERHDPFWQRACLIGGLEGKVDPDSIPDLTCSAPYQRVRAVLDIPESDA